MKKQYDIAAYIWPAYTGDEPRTRMFWPDGIGEWQSVKSAEAKFEGHNWPREPLWGYVNEADPAVMEMQIKEMYIQLNKFKRNLIRKGGVYERKRIKCNNRALQIKFRRI